MLPASIFDILARSALTAYVRRGSDSPFLTRQYRTNFVDEEVWTASQAYAHLQLQRVVIGHVLFELHVFNSISHWPWSQQELAASPHCACSSMVMRTVWACNLRLSARACRTSKFFLAWTVRCARVHVNMLLDFS